MTTYYTLIGKDKEANKWEIIFGAYERETVEQEMQDYEYVEDHDTEGSDYSELRIITTADTQTEVNKAVEGLNKPLTLNPDVTIATFTTPRAIATAPGEFTLRHIPDNKITPYAVHWHNTEDNGYYEGSYCSDICTAWRHYNERVTRWVEAYGLNSYPQTGN
jgi:hypothetical protein